MPLDAETNAPPGTGDVDWNALPGAYFALIVTKDKKGPHEEVL